MTSTVPRPAQLSGPSDDASDHGTTHSLDAWQVPPLVPEEGLVVGVAAGLGREVGIDTIYVRVAFVVLAVAGGWGIALYGLAWLVMRQRGVPIGDYQPRPKAVSSRRRHVGFGALVLGLLLLTTVFQGAFQPALVWPVALVGASIAVAFDRGQIDSRTLTDSSDGRQVQLRLAAGLGLLLAGVVAAVALNFSFWQAMRGVIIAGLVVAGAAVLLSPLLSRLGNELFDERRRRIRSEERADMAAHLHDSVLQTLALIQKRSDDTGVVSLARRQERELRTWLFEGQSHGEALGFRAALAVVMAEVEDLHEVPIEVVVVGDRTAGPDLDPILGASREAATNAARHSASPRIDVFAEVADHRVEVFVRDQGVGFDLDDIDEDRAGIRDSIRARMERHGGEAVIFSRAGGGTEVELVLPLAPQAEEAHDV
ncbi:MAG: PspC domain-containing protein [Actinomycetota bacterium]